MSQKMLMDAGFSVGKATLLPAQKGGFKMAMDAAIQLITAQNLTVPQMFTTYVDPEVVEILTAPTNATELFDLKKVGDWADTQTIFQEEEAVGRTEAYSDYGRGVTTDVNFNYPKRDIYRFQTLIRCGDLEQEMAAKAKVDLLSRKQQAAARVLANDRNEMELFGVSGLSLYGVLNDPNLPSALSPASVGGVTAWAGKDAVAIYNDVLALFADIQSRTEGLVKNDSALILAVPPAVNTLLAKVTNLGVAPVMNLLTAYFPNLKVVLLPQLQDEDGVQSVMLIASELAGKPTGKIGFADVLRTSRVIEDYTAISQKWMSSTFGALLYRPAAVATMTGIQQA